MTVLSGLNESAPSLLVQPTVVLSSSQRSLLCCRSGSFLGVFSLKKKKKKRALDYRLHFWSYHKGVKRSIPFCSAAKYRVQRNYHILCMVCSTKPAAKWCYYAALGAELVNALQYPAPLSSKMCGPKIGWHLIRQNLFFKSSYNLQEHRQHM